MVSSSREKLEAILEKLKTSSVSLQKLNDLYFEAKEIVFNNDDIGEEELTLSINIFQAGELIVTEFALK
jgi:hypothetical protein